MIELAKAIKPNQVDVSNNIVTIILTNKQNNKIGETTIDLVDLPLVISHRWFLHESVRSTDYVYATSKRPRTSIYLHRYLMGLDLGNTLTVDHIDGNGLNNCRNNLRILTLGENCQNISAIEGTSKYRGVSYDKTWNRWVAKVKINGKQIASKYCQTEDEANLAAIELRNRYMTFHNHSRT